MPNLDPRAPSSNGKGPGLLNVDAAVLQRLGGLANKDLRGTHSGSVDGLDVTSCMQQPFIKIKFLD